MRFILDDYIWTSESLGITLSDKIELYDKDMRTDYCQLWSLYPNRLNVEKYRLKYRTHPISTNFCLIFVYCNIWTNKEILFEFICLYSYDFIIIRLHILMITFEAIVNR